jgi:MFS family permease
MSNSRASMTRKSFLIAAFGALSQYYDHHLFGFLAAAISKSFTPATDPVVALLNTYFIMAIAVCAKPFGALVLGRIGDIYGRSTTLKISLLGTSLASIIISITPGYHHIGIIAALILLIARMILVALVQSGTDGVRLYVYEHIGKKHQCFGTGLITSSQLAGSLTASISAWFFTLDSMPHYSWRFAFTLGAVIGIIMLLVVRYNKSEDLAAHKEDPKYDEYLKISTLNIIKQNFPLFITCAILAGSIGGTNHFCVIFFGTYIFKLLGYVDHSTMQLYTTIGIALYMLSAVICGFIADIIGRHIVAGIGFVLLMSCTIVMTFAIKSGYMPVWGYFGMMLSLPILTIPALAFFKQSIPAVMRYRIFSLAHAVGSICISSATPFFSTLLYETTDVKWSPMIYFITILIAISITIYILCKKYGANTY